MPNKNQQSTLGELTEYKFNPKRPVPVPTPILSLKGVPICTPGNISNLQGQAKSAKSSALGAAIAAVLRALMGKQEAPDETLGFTSNLQPNRPGREVQILHFDTEQSPYHHHKLCMDVLTRAGVAPEEYGTLPFHSYSLVETNHSLRKTLIKEIVTRMGNQQQPIVCLFLDGVADIISDPNNAEESFGLVDWLHQLSAKHQFTVLTILHENPGDAGKARGHLGSQILRKSETNLRISKDEAPKKGAPKPHDGHTTTLWIERARGGQLTKPEGVRIRWCKIKKRHTLHDSRHDKPVEKPIGQVIPPRSTQLTKSEERTKKWLESALHQPKIHKELVPMVMKQQRCKERAAKERIKKWSESGWIHKQADAARAPYALGPMPAEPTDSPEPESAKPQTPKGSKKTGSKSAKAKQTENKGRSKTTTAAKTAADGGKPPKKQPKSTNPKARNHPPRKASAAKKSKDKPASSTGIPGV